MDQVVRSTPFHDRKSFQMKIYPEPDTVLPTTAAVIAKPRQGRAGKPSPFGAAFKIA
jgi:hypothetical protein